MIKIAVRCGMVGRGGGCRGADFRGAPELWDRPRSGGTILAQPAIRQAVNACLAQPGSRLVVHHAAGQEGLLAAEELRSWLIALAVDAGRISLRGGLKPSEPLRLEVVKLE